MHKSLIATLVAVVVLGIVLVISRTYTTSTTPIITTSSNQPLTTSSVPVEKTDVKKASAPSTNMKSGVAPTTIGKDAAEKIATEIRSWYAANSSSYAGFSANPENARKIRVIFGSLGTSLEYYQYSTKSAFVVRTHVPTEPKVYCADNTSNTIKELSVTDDKTFRVQTDCSGKAI